jgi:hypothetical protein
LGGAKLVAGTRRPAGEETGVLWDAMRGSPGAGRAKLRLSRGLPLCLTLQRQPPQFLVWARSTPMIYWGDVGRKGFAESPGSGGASPYLRRASPPVWYAGVQNLRLVFTRPPAAASALTSFAPSQFPPSMTSVASVRCFPGDVCYSPASRRVAANQFWPIPISPLCDLRGLCAMLSPRRVLLAREPPRRR